MTYYKCEIRSWLDIAIEGQNAQFDDIDSRADAEFERLLVEAGRQSANQNYAPLDALFKQHGCVQVAVLKVPAEIMKVYGQFNWANGQQATRVLSQDFAKAARDRRIRFRSVSLRKRFTISYTCWVEATDEVMASRGAHTTFLVACCNLVVSKRGISLDDLVDFGMLHEELLEVSCDPDISSSFRQD